MTNQEKWEDAYEAMVEENEIHTLALGDHNLIKSFIRKTIQEAVNGTLDDILEHGHGGGNWRRLIEQHRLTPPNQKPS